MGGKVLAPGAGVGDFAQRPDGAVMAVLRRNEGLEVNEFVGSALFAVGLANIFGVDGQRVVWEVAVVGGCGHGVPIPNRAGIVAGHPFVFETFLLSAAA